MTTISVQQMPNGYEVEKPTFMDWVKAGIGFTIGAALVTFVATVTWVMVGMSLMAAMFSGPHR